MEHPILDLLATSGNPDGSLPATGTKELECLTRKPASFFKSVQWSADGTTLITSSSENRICSFILPGTLLDPKPEPILLRAQGTLVLPESTSAIAPCPYFALDNPSTQVILTASRDHPIHLHYAFPQQQQDTPSPSPSSSTPSSSTSQQPHQPPPLASYRLIKHETEAYLHVNALLWPSSSPGTHFITGATNQISLFDVSGGPDPVLTIPTTPSKTRWGTYSMGMPGPVAALAAQDNNNNSGASLVAAGTWARNVGLYDLQRAGECVATWSVAGAMAPGGETGGVGGNGVVQTAWSPCGRYLVVNERCATGLMVYDVRGAHRLLAYLTGRGRETTNQRLSCDVFAAADGSEGGFEVWSGTAEGNLVVWEGVGNHEGCVEPSWGKDGGHQSAIGGVAMHATGSVVATCSGAWKWLDDEDSNSESSEDEDSEGSEDDQDSEGSGGSSSSRGPSSSGGEGRIAVQKPRVPMVVEETSLRVWSIRAGDGGDGGSAALEG